MRPLLLISVVLAVISDLVHGQCPTTDFVATSGQSISRCQRATVPAGVRATFFNGAQAYVESGGGAVLFASATGTVAFGGLAGLEPRATLASIASGGTATWFFAGADAVATTTYSLILPPTITGATIKIRTQDRVFPSASFSGNNNLIEFGGGNAGVVGDNNQLSFGGGSATVVGNGNFITASSTAYVTATGTSNVHIAINRGRIEARGATMSLTAGPSGTISAYGDGISATAGGTGATVLLVGASPTGTAYAGRIYLQGVSAVGQVQNGGTITVSDYGQCTGYAPAITTSRAGLCQAEGTSATLEVFGANAYLVGSQGTAYVHGRADGPLLATGVVGGGAGIGNTLYADGRASIQALAGGIAFASSGATVSVRGGQAIVDAGATVSVNAAQSGVSVRNGATAIFNQFPATVTAQPQAIIKAATSTVFATATSTLANGDLVYAARARLPSDPALRRRSFPIPTGVNARCPYPNQWCKGLNGGLRCLNTQVDINNCGGCAFGSNNADLELGVDCTQMDGADVLCVAGRCRVY